MSQEMMILLLAVGLTLLFAVFRFVCYRILDKGADALTNAYKQKKNAQKKDETENLSDRYR